MARSSLTFSVSLSFFVVLSLGFLAGINCRSTYSVGLQPWPLRTEAVIPKRRHTVVKTNESRTTNLHLVGIDLSPDTVLALTSEPGVVGSPCNDSLFVLRNVRYSEVRGSPTDIALNAQLPAGTPWYLCIYQSKNEMTDTLEEPITYRHVANYEAVSYALERNDVIYDEDVVGADIFGLRAEGDRVEIENGCTKIPADVNVTVRLFGRNFSNRTELAFTSASRSRGSQCNDLPLVKIFDVMPNNVIDENVVEIAVSLTILEGIRDYYICVKHTFNKGDVVRWIHQGDKPWLRLEPVGHFLPVWFQICLIIFLLCLSGLFSGLNLGLMALDRLELQVIENCGTETEKQYARTISPLRNRGNYLLCSLLLGNVLVNNTLTILLDNLTSGIVAVIGSTMSIVVIGEIIPQALCSRHGLSIGARTVWVTKFFMLATFPLSFPISKILDFVLGEEIGNVYDRERLMEYIRVTKPYNKLENEEVNIISGALELKKKTVSNIMTKIDDVFMVPYDAVLNFETMSEIMKQGYSRIPIFDCDRNNIVGLLNIKDLAFVDPDDNTPLRTLCEFYNHPINYVFEDETLDVMLNEFKKGQSHMAFVRHINNEGDVDPFYEIIGVVTLEDVIEEILQSEIVDETDILTDNRRKQRRKGAQIKQDFSEFVKIGGGQQGNNTISPQLALATFQYLSTSVEPFKRNHISETVLKRLLSQNIFFSSKPLQKEDINISSILYEAGKPADYFVLVLEGRCQVTVGKENLVFETGPFSYFGIPALNLGDPSHIQIPSQISSRSSSLSISINTEGCSLRTFLPDYTVTTLSQTLYMKIHWAVYLAAFRATLMERQKFDPNYEGPYENTWDPVFSASAINDSNFVNNNSPHCKLHNYSPQMGNRTPRYHSKLDDSIHRRASVEVGCISRCPEMPQTDGPLSKSRTKEPVPKPFTIVTSPDIPMIDMAQNLKSLSENEDSPSDKESAEIEEKTNGDGVNNKKKSINGSSELTNERTRLLYPSEA